MLRDTPVTPYIRLAIRHQLGDRDLPQSTAIYHILLYFIKSAKSYQVLLGLLLKSYSAPYMY